jgi:excisionase family DNA binding protein
VAESPTSTRARPVTLNDIAERPALASGLPADAVEALLVRHAAVGQVLLGRLLATRGNGSLAPALPRFVDARTAAERWQVPESWIYDMARQGKLPSVRLGHYVRFRPEDLERFIAERRQGA